MTRAQTLFCLRYAVRVLERYARVWHRLDATVRCAGLLSGTAAFGGLMAEWRVLSIVGGLFFALMQSIEHGIGPANRERQARAAIPLYSSILAKQHKYSDADLEAAYQTAVAADTVIVWESLKRIAFNDVLNEQNGDPTQLYTLSRWQSFLQAVA